jgi:putative hydrolase of the HAD superfamily
MPNLAEVVEHASTLHRSVYLANRQLVAGVRPILEYIHGKVKIAVVTNNIVTEQVDKLQTLQIEHLVDELVTSEETGSIKPDVGIFQAALTRTGSQPTEAVMVGDSWKADIVGAARIGVRAIWLNRTGLTSPDPTLADEIQTFEPLASVLELIFR